METRKNDGHIYKPLMAGLFAGYIATIVNLVYDLFFRSYTAFPLHELINVSTIIFGTLLLLPIAGLAYAFFDRYVKAGMLVYILASVAFCVLCIYGIMHTHRSADPLIAHQFQYLLLGIFLISGAFATIGIPYFFRHHNIYM